MRFWTWIPLFFLLQYSYCGQENPVIKIAEGPGTLTVVAQVPEGAAIYGASLFVNDVEQEGVLPLSLELPAGEPLAIRIEKAGWSFTPAETTLTLLPAVEATLTLTGRSDERRIVLLEDFSNTACPPCPEADEAMWEAVMSASGSAIPIGFHVSWPAGNDPFYLYRPQTQFARFGPAFYNVLGAPYILVDGNPVNAPSDGAEILAAIEAGLLRERALRMSVERIQDEAQVTVNVTGRVDVDPGESDGWRLYVVLYETQVEIPPNLAHNGQLIYRNPMRHVSGESTLPDGALGEPVALTPGGDFQTSVTFHPDFEKVDPAKVRALAFVQHEETFAVLDLAVEPTGGP